jgi:hypothetical protein
MYNFYSPGIIDNAIVKIDYSLEEIGDKGLSEDNLTLYYFNEKTKELEIVPTTVDKDNKKLEANLNHFSKYLIGDSNAALVNVETNIMFVIDNSVSMYSEAQMIQLGYDSSTGAIGNDKYFKRISLTNDMINMFGEGYNFGASEFSGNYANLKGFTTDINAVKGAVESMKNNWHTNITGTNIISALNGGISEFNDRTESNNYLLLLTDGRNTVGSLKSEKDEIVSKAQNLNVKICVIGLGHEIDTDVLSYIAESTGCSYYNATDSSALEEIYSIIASNINYNYVDTDGDNIVDGIIVADSGFIVTRNGFSFNNYSSVQSPGGNCYGMALFALLRYKKQLPTSLSGLETQKFYVLDGGLVKMKSKGFDLSNTYFLDYEKDLYSYKVKTDGLRILLERNYWDEVIDDTWMVNIDYWSALDYIGVSQPYNTREYDGTKYNFKRYEYPLFDIENETFVNNVDREDRELFNAIWRFFIIQQDKKLFERVKFYNKTIDGDVTLNRLIDDLNNKEPTMLNLGGDGNHEINAIKLIQDINDANKFKIEVYDNNYNGETRYVLLTRKKGLFNNYIYKTLYYNYNQLALDYVYFN